MSSGASVSVAPSATTAKAKGSGPPPAANKMKLDMPPRPAKPTRRQPEPGKGEDVTSVPHVVRVTFLGVAGLTAKPSAVQSDSAAQNDAEEGTSSQPLSSTASPADADHPSLLLPLPSNMTVVASVSRSRTARGIPSGMSKPLSASGGASDRQKPPLSITTGGTGPEASHTVSPIAGESIVVETPKLSSAELVARKRSLYDDMHHKVTSSYSSASLPPPSQVMNSRTESSQRSGLRSAVESGSIDDGMPPPMQTEGIEVIRPTSPSEGITKEKKKLEEDVVEEEVDVDPERLVAVWDERKRQPPKAMDKSNQPQFVNQTNSLAFEADLRPSTNAPPASEDEDGRPTTPVASTAFAPKSFCVTVGLVPNFDEKDDNDGGETKEEIDPPAPTFAIPVGFADLVINGNETLDGKRKQVDLPLSSLVNFLGLDNAAKGGSYPFPLIELTAEGLAVANTTTKPMDDADAAKIAATTTGKGKKKSIVKRMFSRRQQQESSATAAKETDAAPPQGVYEGPTPKSIYQLDRPPNAKERALFLERYGVDPSGDAVVRIGLEVFPRGSELEKVFRQKNKLRRKAAAEAANRTKSRNFGRDGRASPSSSSVGSMTADSRSLMDDELDSDGDSIFSQSFFTMDSNASRSTWDESTMYTDALSGDEDSYTTGRKSPQAGATKSPADFLTNLLSCQGPSNLTCGVEGEEDMKKDSEAKDPYANIDQVASAVESLVLDSAFTEERDNVSSPTSEVGRSRSNASRSDASMDTAAMGTKGTLSPESVKESGKELVLETQSKSGSKGPPPPIDTTASFKDDAVSIKKEATPLATIQMVASQDLDHALGDSDQKPEGEGQEITLEDHPSASL